MRKVGIVDDTPDCQLGVCRKFLFSVMLCGFVREKLNVTSHKLIGL